jgi:hypothetical protein
MKKTIYLLATLFVIAAIASCSKEATGDSEFEMLKKATVITVPTASQPVSLGEGVTPYLIPGSNNGGNRTCAEVATAWKLDPNPFLCGEKIDYNNGAFTGVFPSGLNVTVTAGKYVSFNMEDCILIGDKYYKVGAVIVKGSNEANVYYYPEGSISDSNLASPINASGAPAGLSNLTFCFVECERPQLVIAVKSFYWAGSDYETQGYAWTGSEGSYIFLPTAEWCQYLGVIYYPEKSTFPMLREVTRENIGTVTIVEGSNSLIVTVTLEEGGILDRTYLYVGDLEGIYGTGSCPVYTSWLYQDMSDAQTHTFVVPY